MFKDLRQTAGISRVQLAEATGRSIGYILKAEQATFPTPPIALLNYWVKEGEDEDILVAAYYDTQRRIRETWLDMYEPIEADQTTWLPFRRKWQRRKATAVGFFNSQMGETDFISDLSPPTAYRVSVGLCLPAAVVYRNDRDLTKAGSIKAAMGDLVEYLESGRYTAIEFGTDNNELIEGVIRIAKEEGWTRPEHLSQAS